MKSAHDTPLLFENPTIVKIAEKHGKTPAQVLLRWATQRGVAVIPKSNNQGRLRQNLDVTGWELGGEEVESISGLDRGMRFNDPVNVSGVLRVNCGMVYTDEWCSMAFHCRSLCRGRKTSVWGEGGKAGYLLSVWIMTGVACRFRSGSFSTARIRVISNRSLDVYPFQCKSHPRPHDLLIAAHLHFSTDERLR